MSPLGLTRASYANSAHAIVLHGAMHAAAAAAATPPVPLGSDIR